MINVSEIEQNDVLEQYIAGTVLIIVQTRIRFNLIVSILKNIAFRSYIHNYTGQPVFKPLYT
jgi:hypothetical protein